MALTVWTFIVGNGINNMKISSKRLTGRKTKIWTF